MTYNVFGETINLAQLQIRHPSVFDTAKGCNYVTTNNFKSWRSAQRKELHCTQCLLFDCLLKDKSVAEKPRDVLYYSEMFYTQRATESWHAVTLHSVVFKFKIWRFVIYTTMNDFYWRLRDV